jgi:hypothetical protein
MPNLDNHAMSGQPFTLNLIPTYMVRDALVDFINAGLEALILSPSAFDPGAGPQISLKNVSKKLVLVEYFSKKTFLEPGESATLAYGPELRATPLNNGV